MTGDEFTEIDRQLREAYGREPVDAPAVRIAIRREIGRHRAQRLALAAALCATALGGFWALRPRPEPKIFAAAAQDHRMEVVQKAPRHWRTADTDVDTLTARFNISRRQIAFKGYRLLRAKICQLDGQRVLHLVYSDSAAEYSLYLVPGASAIPVAETKDGAEHVAGFHAARVEGLVVGDGTPSDCRRFLKTVTGA